MIKKEYALYKGEDCIGIGTLEELSAKFNIKKKTLLFYKTPSYLKRRKCSKNYRILIDIDMED